MVRAVIPWEYPLDQLSLLNQNFRFDAVDCDIHSPVPRWSANTRAFFLRLSIFHGLAPSWEGSLFIHGLYFAHEPSLWRLFRTSWKFGGKTSQARGR